MSEFVHYNISVSHSFPKELKTTIEFRSQRRRASTGLPSLQLNFSRQLPHRHRA